MSFGICGSRGRRQVHGANRGPARVAVLPHAEARLVGLGLDGASGVPREARLLLDSFGTARRALFRVDFVNAVSGRVFEA